MKDFLVTTAAHLCAADLGKRISFTVDGDPVTGFFGYLSYDRWRQDTDECVLIVVDDGLEPGSTSAGHFVGLNHEIKVDL